LNGLGLGSHACAQRERVRLVLCHLLTQTRHKYQWTNAPTHTPAHRGRMSKWRAM